MTRLFDHLTGMFSHPIKTVRKILLGKPFLLASVIFLGCCISLFITQWIINKPQLQENLTPFVKFYIIELIAGLIGCFVFSSIIHMTADFFGGAGRGINTFLLMIIATLPLWLLGPLAAVFILLMNLPNVYLIAAICILLWSFFLFIGSTRELYRFSTLKAFTIVILPLAGISLLAIVIVYFKLPSITLELKNMIELLCETS
ncbi:YIP1 family protein [bacterium]|nr:YIP1 family protein [candidate division CSSED10-310 bacterium]